MSHNDKVAENVLATIGTVCWTVQLIPQIWKSYREKSTKGLSQVLVLLWALSAVPLGVYAIVQDLSVPLIAQPQLFGTLCLLSWIQCQYYTHWRPRWVCAVVFFAILGIMGGLQAGLVFAIRPSYDRGEDGPVIAFGTLASVMISVALLPQYYEIYIHKEVIGISIPFMLIDLLGGLFNTLSLVFKPDFDIIAGVCYSMVVFLDGLVILAALILNPLAARRRRRAATASLNTPINDPDATPVPSLSNTTLASLEGRYSSMDDLEKAV